MKVRVIDTALGREKFERKETNSQNGNDAFSAAGPKVMYYSRK